ncbi:MAG: ArsC/Spx/MgsR family protein [Sulfitobacter sp.]
MQIYGLKNCDTCRKAMKSLPMASFMDLRENGIPAEVMARAATAFGDALVNTRSTTWRGLDDAARELPQETLLAQFPALMKRPLIVDEAAMYLGWTKDTQAALGVT